MKVYEWLCLFGIPTLIAFIWTTLINRRIKDNERKAEERRRREEVEAVRVAEQQKLMVAQNKAMMLGIQALLRDRLRQGYRHYFAKGWADYEDRSDMENMYTQYHALGQNGAMDGMREQFLELPFENPNS